jgi:uncharacterized protein (DUF58 family)
MLSCILALPCVFINNIYGYLPVLSFLVMLAVSYTYLMLIRRKLAYEELSDLPSCRRETEVDFTVRLRNSSPFVYPRLEPYFYISDLFGDDDNVTAQAVTLAPREERSFDFAVRFDHIGSYSAGLKKIVIHDLLGLFSCTIDNPKRYRVSVAPKIFDVSSLHVSNTVLTESEHMIVPITNEGADYTGVREYVWGDPIKTIHWKLSARSDTYLTKQFESYGTVGITVVLDFFSPEYDTNTLMSVFDAVVESGLSVGNYAEENGMEYEIVYMNKDGEKRMFNRGRGGDYEDVIEDMPRISSTEDADRGVELLREEMSSRYSHGNVIYCTANPTQEAMDTLSEMKLRKKSPALFAIVPDGLDDDARQQLLKPLRTLDYEGIAYYIMSSARELGGGEKS